jgi:hypothetical protein
MMGEYVRKNKQPRKAKQTFSSSPAETLLTRSALETSMLRWAYTREGPIAGFFITGLIGHGAVLDALERVAESMAAQPRVFNDDVAIVQSAWINYQTFGSPGFPVSSASRLREYLQPPIDED